MTLYLKDAMFLDWQSLEIKRTHLAVEEGSARRYFFPTTLPSEDAMAPEDRVMDCAGKLVTKSFGCGHHHIYSTLARGMPAPRKIPANFTEILAVRLVAYRQTPGFGDDRGQCPGFGHLLRQNGVTFVIDHHASPLAIKDSLSTIAQGLRPGGNRPYACATRSPTATVKDPREEGLAETEATF